MRFLVLGSTAAVSEGDEVRDLGARKPRSVVAALALTPGRPVAADRLADLVWAGEPPRAAHGALHSYLSHLRRALDRSALIETTDHGYVLRVEPADVDSHFFAAEVRACEQALAPLTSQLEAREPEGWPAPRDVAEIVERLDAALLTWRG